MTLTQAHLQWLMEVQSLWMLDQTLRQLRMEDLCLMQLLLLGMGITESRTGLLSGFVLCFWWLARRQVFTLTVRWFWVLTSALALVAVMWAWPPFITLVQEGGSTSRGEAIDVTPGSRMELWRQLWEAAWMKPWLGWGLRGVSTAHNAVLHSYTSSEQQYTAG